MYPASDWSCCAPGHHGYQRACDLISGQASTGHLGHQCSHAPGRPILHLFSSSRRPRQVTCFALATFGYSLFLRSQLSGLRSFLRITRLRSFLRIACRLLAYSPAACRAWSVRDGLSVRSSSGGGCFSFMGQFCQNPTQREWAIPVGDPSGEAYSVPSAITLSISLASFLKWTARRS